MKMKALLILLSLLFLSGCATIVNGTKQTVSFMSEPSGAQVTVGGDFTAQTPCAHPLKKNQDYVVVFKKEGYKTQQIVLKSDFDHVLAATLGNIWNYILPGLIVDSISGGAYALDKSLVHIVLEKDDGATKTPLAKESDKKPVEVKESDKKPAEVIASDKEQPTPDK